MKQITIISGKGGTGKTTIASNFIKLAMDHIAVDCDVDAANLHILLNPEIKEKKDFTGGAVAEVSDECTSCGECEKLCRFEAISNSSLDIKIDPIRCEGCGVCEYICPVDAIKLVSHNQGYYYTSESSFCTLVHARLNPGAENSGLLVTRVRNAAEDIANDQNKKAIIIDGAPGIGCPVISSLNGVDYAMIVTEPTLSGIGDFIKVFEVTKFFNIKTFACVNKYDINLTNTEKIYDFCLKNDIELIGKIPYDDKVPTCLSNKKFIIDEPSSEAGKEIKKIWEKIKEYLYPN